MRGLRTGGSPEVAIAAVSVPTGLVQRHCACSRKVAEAGECEQCRKKRLEVQREPARSRGDRIGSSSGLPLVRETLLRPGRPLDDTTRTEMEFRLGHDFSRVRVHTDSFAARSARAVDARAYTVGNDIAFGPGEFRPREDAGRRLLVHELVHTIQQRQSAAPRDPIHPSLEVGPPDDPREREAHRVAEVAMPADQPPVGRSSTAFRLQRIPLPPGPRDPPFREREFPLEGLGEPLGTELERGGTLPYREATELARCVEYFGEGQEAPTCEPSRDLTWDDFTGAPPAGASHDANTRPDLRLVQFPVGSSECRHIVLGEPLDLRQKVQSFLDTGATWVRQRWKHASDPAQNTCNQQVADCEAFFDREAAAGRQGGNWRLRVRANCPATVQPDPTAVATSRDECRSVLLPACNQREVAESARLLRHEQLHFDFGCVLARKANQMIAGGGDPNAVLRGARALLQPLHDQYDGDTDHGCLPGPQADWEQRVENGLPTVDIRPRFRRRRRRRPRGRRRR